MLTAVFRLAYRVVTHLIRIFRPVCRFIQPVLRFIALSPRFALDSIEYLLRSAFSPILVIPIIVSGSTITSETLLSSTAFFLGIIGGMYFLQLRYRHKLESLIDEKNSSLQRTLLLATLIFSGYALYNSFAHIFLNLWIFKIPLTAQSISDQGLVIPLSATLLLVSVAGAFYFRQKNEAATPLFLGLISFQMNLIAVACLYVIRDFNDSHKYFSLEVGRGFFALLVSGLCLSLYIAIQRLTVSSINEKSSSDSKTRTAA